MKVGVVFGVSELADFKAFEKKASEFLTDLAGEFDVLGGFPLSTRADFKEAKSRVNFNNTDAIVIYPLTGGTEGVLKEFSVFRRPTVVFGDAANNSLAAGVELREYFRNRLVPSVLVRDFDGLVEALQDYNNRKDVLERFLRMRIGLIGRVSPWLINERFDIPYTSISLKKFYEYYDSVSDDDGWNAVRDVVEGARTVKEPDRDALTRAGRIFLAIERILKDYRLDGFSIGCFDLIGRINSTPCLALAMFNARGVPAACEGEMTSLVGMMVLRRFFDEPAFMGNIADYGDDYILLAHCTAPLWRNYLLRSHFESGIGVGVDAEMPEGDAVLFKLRGRKAVVAPVEVVGQEHAEFRCRTQVRLRLKDAREFVDGTAGNHHLLAYVDAEELAELLSELGFEVFLY